MNRAVDPPGEARADFDIFLDVAAALGCRDELFPGWTKPGDAFEEWKRVSAGRLCDYSGMTYDADRGARRHPVAVSGAGASSPAPTPRNRVGSTPTAVFQTDDGRARLIPTSGSRFPSRRPRSSRSC